MSFFKIEFGNNELTNYKYCKRCSFSLPINAFYKNAFYCKRCFKIISALSKNKTTIKTAMEFWDKQRRNELWQELNLFEDNSTEKIKHYSWMMALFFASIPEKQWHIYLYVFYLYHSHNKDENEDKENEENKEYAEKALCKETMFTIEQEEELVLHLKEEEYIIDNNKIYNLSIPFLTEFYKKTKPRLKRQIAIFTRTKICASCKVEQFTHEDAHNPQSTYNLLTLPPKKLKIKGLRFRRSYNTRDGWHNICKRCEELNDPKSITSQILKNLKYENDNYDSAKQIEKERKEYEISHPFIEINEERKQEKIKRLKKEGNYEYETVDNYDNDNDNNELNNSYPPVTGTPENGGFHKPEKSAPDSDSIIEVDFS